MISRKAAAMTSPFKIGQDLKKWKDSEELFSRILPVLQKTSEEDNINHADFEFDTLDVKVDVKGLKESHENGFIIIELFNVQGNIGWCHKKSEAKFLAFQFPDHFIVVPKSDLLELLHDLLPKYDVEEVERGVKFKEFEKHLYKYIGRRGRKDVLTYIKKEDLNKIPHIIYPTKNLDGSSIR